MDTQKFDSIARLAGSVPDRRNMLKLAGAAALAGVAGAAFRSEDAEAALVNVIVTNVLNDLSIEIPIKNNNVAVQVCAAVDDINALFVDDDGGSLTVLTCEVDQSRRGRGPGA